MRYRQHQPLRIHGRVGAGAYYGARCRSQRRGLYQDGGRGMIRAERYAMRQTALIIFAAISAITTSAWAAAPADVASYPPRPVRLVIPFPPGGGLDFLARLAAQELGQRLGQTIVTDNRVGASGKIG